MKTILNILILLIILLYNNCNYVWAFNNKNSCSVNDDSNVFKISLVDSITTTLTNNYSISMDRENTKQQKGYYLIEKGIFDWNIIIQIQGNYIQNELTPREWTIETVKRNLLYYLSQETYEMAESIANNSDATDFIDILKDVTIKDKNDKTNLLRDIEQSVSQSNGVYTFFLNDMHNTYIDRWGENEEEELLLNSFYLNIENACEEKGLGSEECYRYLSENSKKWLDHLGNVPKTTVNIKAIGNIGIKKLFKNGILIFPRISMKMNSYQYKNKPRSIEYGGTGQVDTYKSNIGIEINIPYSKKNSKDVTSSLEKISQLNSSSAQHQLEHTKRKSILTTTILYWKLIYFQKRINVIKEVISNEKKVGLSKQNTNIQKAYFEAKQAQLCKEKQGLLEVQSAFSESVGLTLDKHFVLAIGSFPKIIYDKPDHDKSNIDKLIKKAFKNRYDYKSLLSLEKAARIQVKAYRDKLNSEKTINISFFYQGREESNNVSKGIEGIFKNLTGPSIFATFNMQIPHNNNSSKAEYLQAKSLLNKVLINLEYKKKEIITNINRYHRTFEHVIQRLHNCKSSFELYSFASNAYKSAFDGGLKEYQDLLKINRLKIDSQLNLLKAQYEYSEILTKLKYEIGDPLENIN